MNPIQKAWLRVLKPVIHLVNDKIAKRSGLVGKFGRFFSFGPRQFGYHTFNRYLAVVNDVYMSNAAFALHRYSLIKFINMNGFFTIRATAAYSILGTLTVFGAMLALVIPPQFATEEGTSLDHLRKKGLPAHYNSLNDRVSAHFTEINSLYSYQMLKRMRNKEQQIAEKSLKCLQCVKWEMQKYSQKLQEEKRS